MGERVTFFYQSWQKLIRYSLASSIAGLTQKHDEGVRGRDLGDGVHHILHLAAAADDEIFLFRTFLLHGQYSVHLTVFLKRRLRGAPRTVVTSLPFKSLVRTTVLQVPCLGSF